VETLSPLPLSLLMVVSGFLSLVSRVDQVSCLRTRADWIAFYIPQLGVTTAYETEGELASALAIYLSAWAIVTLIFLIVCPKTSDDHHIHRI
jgi:hypothetical protein